MNKQTLLNCYCKDQNSMISLIPLMNKHPLYFTKTALQPENLKVMTPKLPSVPSSSVMSDTLSFYTSLSRLTIGQSILDHVITNPSQHRVFHTIEEAKQDNFKWFYRNQKREIFGPFNANKMDDMYHLRKLNKQISIKTCQDDDFIPIIVFLKRYSKIFKEKNLTEMKVDQNKVSNKIMKFRKGVMTRQRLSSLEIDNFQFEFKQQTRTERTMTSAPRPMLQFNPSEIPMGRERANTKY